LESACGSACRLHQPGRVSIAIGGRSSSCSPPTKLRDRRVDDFLNIRSSVSAPSFYQELQNAVNANRPDDKHEDLERRDRVSFYGVYQYQQNVSVHRQARRAGPRTRHTQEGRLQGTRQRERVPTDVHSRRESTLTPRNFVDLGLSLASTTSRTSDRSRGRFRRVRI